MSKYDSAASTLEHKMTVIKYMNLIIHELLTRAEEHDNLKLQDQEKELFDVYTPKLADTEYGSEEYKEQLAGLKPALDHHYARYRHHPEHFKNGVKDMNLIDLIEMLCDWKAASFRQMNGNILTSIHNNAERFGYSEELSQIFVNSVDLFE